VSRLAAAAAGTVLAVAACGGRVEEGSSPGPPATTIARPPTSTPPGPPGPPPVLPGQAVAIASEIAAAYCPTFAGCCSAIGQPPIDIARCHEVKSKVLAVPLAEALQAPNDSPASRDVEACLSAIRTRTAACAKEDGSFGFDDQAFFGPKSVQSACAPLLRRGGGSTETCSPGQTCSDGRTCAIDECVDDRKQGESCVTLRCLDSLVCRDYGGPSPICSPRADADVGASCTVTVECRLGLVCFDGSCARSRGTPDEHTIRFSPYRVGADTCRVFAYL
jgi:hypothetical protein